jgi:hypothetical protein
MPSPRQARSQKAAAKLGREHSYLEEDLQPKLICSKCCGKKLGMIVSPWNKANEVNPLARKRIGAGHQVLNRGDMAQGSGSTGAGAKDGAPAAAAVNGQLRTIPCQPH